MFEITNATGGYEKTRIIEDASIKVDKGEVVALLGRNGVGKTTLFKYAMGLIDRENGSVSLGGKELPAATSRRVRAGLGYVPQGRFVFPRLTVSENIAAAAAANRHDRKKAVAQALEDFPLLKPKANTLAGKLSGGQQQVLAMARALATEPEVLLLDEPTEGIQPSIIDDIAGIIKTLNVERGISILVAEQDLEFCRAVAKRAYVMDRGQIVDEVSIEALLENEELVQRLLGV